MEPAEPNIGVGLTELILEVLYLCVDYLELGLMHGAFSFD